MYMTDSMIFFFMFGDVSWGGAFVSTPSAGHRNNRRIACASVTGYGLLLQGQGQGPGTYNEEKN